MIPSKFSMNFGMVFFKVSKACVTLVFTALLLCSIRSEAQVGVTYGGSGNNLPSQQQVVNLYKSNGIQRMRIYYPDPAILQAVQGSNIQLILDVPNDQVQGLAQNPSLATQWVQTNVVPYSSNIRYIGVGNEVPQQVRQFVGPALQNVQNALNAAPNNLGARIKVTTAIGMSLIQNSFPPSNGEFTDLPFMNPIVNFLTANGSPLMVNIYPYFTYVDNTVISLDYALFTAPGTVVTDSNNGLQYQNLFDALLDSVYAALSRAGAPMTANLASGHHAPHTSVVVTESGWPSGGGRPHGAVMSELDDNAGDPATLDNAGIYYRNLINHVPVGSPLKPGPLEVYLFAMFDEDQKPGDPTEQHFGLFSPNQQPKYGQLNFN